MDRKLVFVPTSKQRAVQALEDSSWPGPVEAHTVTDELMSALGYTDAQLEHAEYAALLLASVAGLTRFGRRFVVVADVDEKTIAAGRSAVDGEITLSQLDPRSMVAFFLDEDPQLSSAVADAVAGMQLDEAWEHPAVKRLVWSCDLMWHAAEELRVDEEE